MTAPLLDTLKLRMAWLQARQMAVSTNIANANSPGFRPSDVEPFSPSGSLNDLPLAITDANHTLGNASVDSVRMGKAPAFETQPSGNAVSLEDEMTKLADIQLDYQIASELYTKSLGLIKIAIGKK
jgi:flagellar basal-body rod protein FlgB